MFMTVREKCEMKGQWRQPFATSQRSWNFLLLGKNAGDEQVQFTSGALWKKSIYQNEGK